MRQPSSYIQPLLHNSPICVDQREMGGKVLALRKLWLSGIEIPLSFVVPTSEYVLHIRRPTAAKAIQDALHSESTSLFSSVREIIYETPLREGFAEEVHKLFEYLSLQCGKVPIVARSSANVEDGKMHSFAGIFDSTVGIKTIEELIAAIKHCWSSIWTPRSEAYCQSVGVSLQSIQMAVLIQEMVLARASGVAFTCDPVTMNLNSLIIEAIAAQGEELVSGKISPNRYILRVGSDDRVLDLDQPPSLLTDANLEWLRSVCTTMLKHFGEQLEIEWAIDNKNSGYVLQARPITTKVRR